jgi:hypothetical protein
MIQGSYWADDSRSAAYEVPNFSVTYDFSTIHVNIFAFQNCNFSWGLLNKVRLYGEADKKLLNKYRIGTEASNSTLQ